jgi:hypothetical protein
MRDTGAAAGIDQGAYLQQGLSGDAVDGGNEPGKAEIDLGSLNRGCVGLNQRPGCFHSGFGGEVVLDGVVEILLAGGLLFCQWRVTVDVKFGSTLDGFGVGELRLRLRQLSLCLVKRGLKRAWIDLEQKLTFLDRRALLIALLQQVARNLRSDVGVDESVESADPLSVNRNVLLLDLQYFDNGRAWLCS